MITIKSTTLHTYPKETIVSKQSVATQNRDELSFFELFHYEKLRILQNFINFGTFDCKKRCVLFGAVNYIEATFVITLKTDLFGTAVNVIE